MRIRNQSNETFYLFNLIILILVLSVNICYGQTSDNKNGDPTHFDLHEEKSPYRNVNFTYHKCVCDLWKIERDVRKNDTCVYPEIEAAILLLQNLQPESDVLFNFLFSPVKINDVKCTTEDVLVNLENNNFYLLNSGELYSEELDYLFSPGNYCFEFVEIQDVIDVVARVCVPPPSVPVCNNDSAVFKDISSLQLNISYNNEYKVTSNITGMQFSEPKCGTDQRKITIPLDSSENNLTYRYLAGNVELIWKPPFPTNVPVVYSSENYCITKDYSNQIFYAIFCYDDPILKHQILCKDSVCVRKCCPEHHVYNLLNRSCFPYETMNNVSLFSFYDFKNKTITNEPDNLVIEYSFPWCQNHSSLVYDIEPKVNPSDEFFFLQNGSLYLGLSKITIPPSMYCVDSFLENDIVTVKAISCNLEKTGVINSCKLVHRILYPVLIVISCLFLSITLIVYASMPELHSKLHGKSLISHVVSLLVAFLCQLIVSWGSESLSMIGCKIVALFNQVSFLWAFFWLNVMCFDIWWTLKTMSPVPETGEDSRRRFGLYSLYAWGCPLVICFITALLEFLPNTTINKTNLILPGFGIRGCWFQDVKSTWIYFHGFTLTLYVLNIFFFFHVAAILLKGQRATEGILRTTRKQHKERVYLYLKLFVVMGITWVCEVASWQEGTCEYWIFTDIVNSFQGVMIFCIFMCNRMVFQKVQAKGLPFFRRLKAIVRTPSSSNGPGVTRANSSSQGTIKTDEVSLRRLSTASNLQISKES